MKNLRTIFIFIITIFCWSITFCQMTIKEKDYSMVYSNRNIELEFNSEVQLKAFAANTNRELELQSENQNAFTLVNPPAGQIIKLEYSFSNNKNGNANVQTSYIAAESLSTGTMNVFFNHPVNTAFAQTQSAVNLGNTLDDMLITYINACVSTLDIAIYNSYSPSSSTGIAGAINAAYTRGVQIRVIYDGSTSSVMIPLLNPAIPTLASPNSSSYGIMHNKFVVFDANNADANKPYVWTGSTNWTVVQIDGPDSNSSIVIQDQALAQGYRMEFEEMWGSTTMAPNVVNSKFGPYKTDNTPHHYLINGKIIDSYFSPSDGVTSKIIEAINTANTDLDIATMLITRSDVSSAILNKYNSGVTNVNLVVDSQNPSGNQLSTIQAGLPANKAVVFTAAGIMHHKFMVVDNFNSASDPLVLLGSHNWSSSAETKNDENTLIVHDANITNQYYQAFAYLFQLAGGALGTSEHALTNSNLILYPNPTNGILHLATNDTSNLDEVNVTLYDVLGNRIYQKRYTNLVDETIDISNQSSGMYFINVESNGKATQFKMIKE
jgi:hypothetical protein